MSTAIAGPVQPKVNAILPIAAAKLVPVSVWTVGFMPPSSAWYSPFPMPT